MSKLRYLLYTVVFLLVCCACDSSSSESSTDGDTSEHNVLKEYVKTPLDKADAVSKKADQRTQQINRALDE